LGDDYCFVIAPHEINEHHLNEIETRFSGELVVRYSKAQLGDIGTKRVLLMDNMGMLSRVYRYGSFAVIGGGFGKGLHNTLEAAVYGIPLAFGPNHKQFREALELLETGAAISDDSESSLVESIVELLNDKAEASKRGEAAKAYVQERVGATGSIMNYMIEKDLIHE
jgi:3-deoxy-D-manno-octulosonic-acid transferase